MPPDDLAALIEAVAESSDRTAFRGLFDYFGPRLRAYLRRLGCNDSQAEELLQEVMLLVWRRAETFDRTQATATTWVYTITRNKRIDAARRDKRPELDPDDPALVPEAPPASDVALEARQRSALVRAALDILPQEQSDLVRRAYYDEKPHSAIASETGLPLGTVKSRLRLAMARLRAHILERQ
jgi:RNA polymerase sigma-70 factor (ECF subfamily)